MALGDGIRRNIAQVDPSERALLRDAFIELNKKFFPGTRTDPIPGGVSWWFKQGEIHAATHVHNGPEFIPWHRELVNRLEEMLRQINPQLSLHYWDWTQDPRAIPNANLGGGTTGTLNLFTPSFMGYGGPNSAPIGEPWLSAGYYVPGASLHRDATNNPADPPNTVVRFVNSALSPASVAGDNAIVNAVDYPTMRNALEGVHNTMHGFVAMGGQHTSFRDPFVFLLHSNVDRLFARWQTDPAHPERLDPNAVYGLESGNAGLNSNIRPWSGVPPTTRPWAPPENQQVAKNYKHPSVVAPPRIAPEPPGGTDDILWQHRDGTVHYWPIRNGQRQCGINIGGTGPVGQEWRLIGAGDMDGDGTDDILWQHKDGTVHYWKILNGQRQGGFNIGGTGPVGPEWRLIGAANLNGN